MSRYPTSDRAKERDVSSQCRLAQGQLLSFVTLLTHVHVCFCSPGGCPSCKFNAVCLHENGEFRCSCDPIQCDGTYRPLCGKDGKTYINDCERKLEECRTKTDIPVKQLGPCGEFWTVENCGIVLLHCTVVSCFWNVSQEFCVMDSVGENNSV